jgi:hypothetical protein
MGSYGSTGFNYVQRVQPHRGDAELGRRGDEGLDGGVERRGVAVQVAFESKFLKPGFHLIGSMVETRRFQANSETGFSLDRLEG